MTASTPAERLQWFRVGVERGCDFLIVVTDQFDHEDYPVYATAAELHKTVAKYNGPNMQEVMEVFDLKREESRVQLDGFVRDDLGTLVSLGASLAHGLDKMEDVLDDLVRRRRAIR